MEPAIISAIISASVSLFVVGLSRLVFKRSDKRFAILKNLQFILLKLQSDPPSLQGMVGYIKWPELQKTVEPYLIQLSMVSFPHRNCAVQKAWQRTKDIFTNESGGELCDGLTTKQFQAEIANMLKALSRG